jgi:hypothetical protein
MGSEKRATEQRTARPGAVPDPVILEIRYRPPEHASERTTADADQGQGTRADVARQLNASIYKAGRSLADQGDEEFELTFFCACGCMTEVKRSLRDYVIRGAVVTGHVRPAGCEGDPPSE